MSNNYRDAISVCRKLEVSYLWIDSLCIVQDSKEDWDKESTKMADIYSRAFITIAATRGENSSVSLFHNYQQREVSGTNEKGLPYRLFSLEYGEITHHMKPERKQLFQLFPLLSRGWVFQEQLLSPRMIHFGYRELLWNCHERALCECSRVNTEFEMKTNYWRALTLHTDQGEIRRRMSYQWRKLIEDFSRLELSYKTDTLPAISGLAKQFLQKRPDSKYLAGTWSNTILDDMLWSTPDYSVEKKPMPAKWRAPSWSWASTDDRVFWPLSLEQGPTSKDDLRPKVLDAECIPAGIDPTGQVRSGHIKLLGIALQGVLIPKLVEGQYQFDLFLPGNSYASLYTTDDPHEQELERSLRPRAQRLWLDHRQENAPNSNQPRPLAEVVCLRMNRFEGVVVGYVFTKEHFLVLELVDQTMGIYKRIGLGITSEESYKDRDSLPIENNWDLSQLISRSEHKEEEKMAFWDTFESPFDFAGKEEEVITII